MLYNIAYVRCTDTENSWWEQLLFKPVMHQLWIWLISLLRCFQEPCLITLFNLHISERYSIICEIIIIYTMRWKTHCPKVTESNKQQQTRKMDANDYRKVEWRWQVESEGHFPKPVMVCHHGFVTDLLQNTSVTVLWQFVTPKVLVSFHLQVCSLQVPLLLHLLFSFFFVLFSSLGLCLCLLHCISLFFVV